MNIVVISDIHSNWEALKAFGDEIQPMNIERLYCLGDVVGYGGDPEICLDFILHSGVPCCIGNHDATMVGDRSHKYMNWYARAGIQYSERQIPTDKKAAFKAHMQKIITPTKDVFMVHGAPWGDGFDYIDSRRMAIKAHACQFRPGTILFVGHTHQATLFSVNEENAHEITVAENYPYKMDKTSLNIVNVGSIGQPRDGDPRACFVIWDPVANTVTFRRVEYDVDMAQQSIRNAGLPELLAKRLEEGR